MLDHFPYMCGFLCICSVYIGYFFFQRDLLIFFSTHRSCLHPVQFMGCFPYLFSMYNFVTLFERCILFFFRFISALCSCLHPLHMLCVFPVCMYLHCIHMLHFLEKLSGVFFFQTHKSCQHPLYLFGLFPYLIPLYTFVTLFEDVSYFFL